ncbi:hypothetical protein JXA34_02575 [Patescibacteria group bacterium]|nr:hypothetical protein [Patescibacteria group bacterium]
MKKKHLILIILLILPLFVTACKKNQTTQEVEDTTPKASDTTETTSGKIKGSILDLLSVGKNYKCTYSKTDENFSFEGVSYIAGDKVRSDTKMTLIAENEDEDNEEMEFESHSLVKNKVAYTWGSMMEKGVKIDLNEIEDKTDQELPDTPNGEAVKNMREEFEYDCNPWVVDNSKFDVPTDVEFVDMNEMLDTMTEVNEDMQEGMETMKEAACKACNSLPDAAAKADCLADLECN